MTTNRENSRYAWTAQDWNVCTVLPIIVGLYVVAVNLWGFGA